MRNQIESFSIIWIRMNTSQGDNTSACPNIQMTPERYYRVIAWARKFLSWLHWVHPSITTSTELQSGVGGAWHLAAQNINPTCHEGRPVETGPCGSFWPRTGTSNVSFHPLSISYVQSPVLGTLHVILLVSHSLAAGSLFSSSVSLFLMSASF